MADGANKNVTLASVRSGQKKLQRDDVTKSEDIKQSRIVAMSFCEPRS